MSANAWDRNRIVGLLATNLNRCDAEACPPPEGWVLSLLVVLAPLVPLRQKERPPSDDLLFGLVSVWIVILHITGSEVKTFDAKLGRTFKPYLRNPPRSRGRPAHFGFHHSHLLARGRNRQSGGKSSVP